MKQTNIEQITRVALYIRVSTEDQAKRGFSLDAQKNRLRAYCEAREWEIVKEYTDEGFTGTNIKRPGYKEMMIDRKEWDTILVIKMDRIHRNSRNFMEMMDKLKRWKKDFTSMQESLDTSTAMGRFVVDIIQRIAQLESEETGERTYLVMKEKAKIGYMLGFNAPLGYDFTYTFDKEEDRTKVTEIVVNDAESAVVRKIFNMYIEGLPMHKIAAKLNRKRLRTKRSNRFTRKSVGYILHNPIYAGFLQWSDSLARGNHKAIIDARDFNKAQIRAHYPMRVTILCKLPTMETSDEDKN